MKKIKIKKKIKILDDKEYLSSNLNNKSINLINVNYKTNAAFGKISSKSNDYIKNCFEIAFQIIKKTNINSLITVPISKKTFLNKKY